MTETIGPNMLDVAVAYRRYQFLGEEFLTWLWYVVEKNQDLIKNFDPRFVALEIGNLFKCRFVENPRGLKGITYLI